MLIKRAAACRRSQRGRESLRRRLAESGNDCDPPPERDSASGFAATGRVGAGIGDGGAVAATAIIAVVVPFAAGVSLLGTVPMGLLAYRYRFRVLIAATVAGATIAFLIAGMGGFMTVVNCAYIGGLTGIIKRRGRGTPTVLVAGLAAGVVFGIAGVAALTVLARLRNLIFESMTANVDGIAAFMSRIPDMEVLAEKLKSDFATALHTGNS